MAFYRVIDELGHEGWRDSQYVGRHRGRFESQQGQMRESSSWVGNGGGFGGCSFCNNINYYKVTGTRHYEARLDLSFARST